MHFSTENDFICRKRDFFLFAKNDLNASRKKENEMKIDLIVFLLQFDHEKDSF